MVSISVMRIMGITESLIKLQDALDASKKAYYVRFGDGDSLMLNKSIKRDNRNKQENTRELRKELHESLNINEPFYLRAASGSYPIEPGMVDGLFAPFYNREDLDVILTQQLDEPTEELFNPILFHYLGVFAPKVLTAFIDRNIRHRSTMFIGSCSKEAMEKFFGKIKYYVETPSGNSYGAIQAFWPQVEKFSSDVDNIILATGQTSKVLAKRLWKINAEVHCIDIGSIVDPLDGKFNTRTCWKMKGREVRSYFNG